MLIHRFGISVLCSILLTGVVESDANAQATVPVPVPSDMRRVRGGVFRPFYRPVSGETVRVASFALDQHPVTNAEFLAFVRAQPRWQRSHVVRLFADERYLSRWQGDTDLGADVGERQPVVAVSWFAASAYCRWRGRRLPTENEWEFAGRAGEHAIDASHDPRFVQQILRWYERRLPDQFANVMSGTPNYWGLYDMHGLIWEWVSDFNPPTVSSDSRQPGDSEVSRFCGGAALDAADRGDYAAFIRYALRYSLRPAYTVQNLGFRCALTLGR